MRSAVQERMLFPRAEQTSGKSQFLRDIMALEKLLTPGRIGNMELNYTYIYSRAGPGPKAR